MQCDPLASIPEAMDQRQMNRPARILRIREVASRVGLSRSSIYVRIKAGQFPGPIKQGASSGWLESEISDHILKLAAAPREPLK